MVAKKLFIIFNTFIITIHGENFFNYYHNPSDNIHPIISVPNNMKSKCQSSSFCSLMKGFPVDPTTYVNNPFITTSTSVRYRRKTPHTALQSRSYYGYGANAGLAPIYPTFDPISVLASLAFLAFLLQSFVSLFDRSRSVIPSIISSRDSTPEHEIPDLISLILRAIDEYSIFDESSTVSDDKEIENLS